MSRSIKNFLFVFLVIGALLFIDSNAYVSEVEAGQPSVPTEVKVKKVSSTSTKLSWTKAIDASSYDIYLKDGDDFTLLDTVDGKEDSVFIHNELTPNKEYTYAIKAKNSDGLQSDYSFFVSCYTGDQSAKYTNIKSMEIVNAKKELFVGDTVKLPLTITNEEQNLPLVSTKVSWWTSNIDMATIDNDGNFKAISPGKVIVWAKGHNGLTASHTIEIKKKVVKSSKVTKPYKRVYVSVPQIYSLKAKRLSSTQIKLSWAKDKGNVGYEIYRKKKGNYHKIAIVRNNYYIDKKLKKNKKYTYKVQEVKEINNKSYHGYLSYYVSAVTTSKNGKYTNVKSVKFTKKSKNVKNIAVNNKVKLKVKLYREKSDRKLKTKKIRWYSSNESIARVDKSGYVTALAPGKVVIYAKAHNGVTANLKITVNSKYADKLPILTFHRIVSDSTKKEFYPNYQWVASVKDFEAQMKYLYDNGYKTLSIEEYDDWYSGKVEYPKKTVLITFDDGDYELYYLVLPILKKYNFKAVSFMVGVRTGKFTQNYKDNGSTYYLGEDKINEIKTIYPNLEFESHSYNLHYRDSNSLPIAYSKNYFDFDNDFISNKKFDYDYIAYPYGAYNSDFIKAVEDNGMKLAFTFGTDTYSTRKSPKYAIPRVKINGQISYNNYVKKMKNYLK